MPAIVLLHLLSLAGLYDGSPVHVNHLIPVDAAHAQNGSHASGAVI